MIGNRLYLLRKAAGLSQAELGDMLSVSHHTISAYEKRKVTQAMRPRFGWPDFSAFQWII